MNLIKFFIAFLYLLMFFGCKSREKEEIVKYYSNGEIYSVMQYYLNDKDTIYDGLVKFYFPGQKIEQEFQYKEGKKNGTQRIFNKEGNVTAELFFKNDLRHGYSRFYYDSGHLYTLYREGNLIMSKSFFANGALQSICVFLDENNAKFLLENDSTGKEIQRWGTIIEEDTLLVQ